MSKAFLQDLLITGFPCLDLFFRETGSGRCGLIDRLFDIQKAVDHLIGPVLLVLLVHEDSTRADGERCTIHADRSSRSRVFQES